MQSDVFTLHNRGLNATKPAFGVSDKGKLKSVTSATETRYKIGILLVASPDTILSNKRLTKALIRLVCAFAVRKPPKIGFLASRPIFK